MAIGGLEDARLVFKSIRNHVDEDDKGVCKMQTPLEYCRKVDSPSVPIVSKVPAKVDADLSWLALLCEGAMHALEEESVVL